MSKELSQAIKEIEDDRMRDLAIKNKFEWKFNLPTASHMGGTWERLIRSVKTALSTVLKDQAPREEVLITMLVEIEHVINSRPLTHVSVDPRDQEALMPNHFLIGASSEEVRFGGRDIETECSRKQWRVTQYFVEMFWRRWLHEYLPTLIPRKKWQNYDKPLQIGDLVLILDENIEMNQWRKGVVTRAFPRNDGQVRVVKIKTANGTIKRPSRKLVKFSEVQTT